MDGSRSHETLAMVMALALPLLAAVTVAAAAEGMVIRQPCPGRMNGTLERRYGTYVVWQVPSKPKAVLLMAHGGFKEPLSYFDSGPACRQCYGLPEDRAVVLDALERGYAVLVLKSLATSGYDTVPIEPSVDLALAARLIPEWTREQSLEGLPLFAWGHSQGGLFLTALTQRLSIQALVLMCIEGLQPLLKDATPEVFPPTFFAYMPVDEAIAEKIVDSIAILRGRGVEVAEKLCLPKPLSPLYFTERIPCMTDEMSREVYWAFKAAGWLDSNNYLTKNPQWEDWEAVLRNAHALPVCDGCSGLFLASQVEQELQSAFAFHSITSDADEEIYPWLDSLVPPSIESATLLSAI